MPYVYVFSTERVPIQGLMCTLSVLERVLIQGYTCTSSGMVSVRFQG